MRDLIAKNALPGPRLLTSLAQITDKSAIPPRFVHWWTRLKADGADVIKLFATAWPSWSRVKCGPFGTES